MNNPVAVFAFAAAMSAFSVANASVRVDYDALFKAIAQVESESGRTSGNRYQLTYAFVYDLERITGEPWPYNEVTRSKFRSEVAMRTYWAYYSSRWFSRTGETVTPSLLARIHRVGYRGLTTKRAEADRYWLRVSPWYERFARENERNAVSVGAAWGQTPPSDSAGRAENGVRCAGGAKDAPWRSRNGGRTNYGSRRPKALAGRSRRS